MAMKFEYNPQHHEQIGVGGYKRAYKVVSEAGTPEVQLVMKHRYTNEQMKGLFYLNKIATLLFPGKVASVRQAGNVIGKENTIESSQFRAGYIKPDAIHEVIQDHAKAFDGDIWAAENRDDALLGELERLTNERIKRMKETPEIEDFQTAYEAAGFVNDDGAIKIGWGAQDVIFGESGDFTFVDIDVPWDEPDDVGEPGYTPRCLRFDPVKLKLAIATLPEPQQSEAHTYFGRLEEQMRSAGFSVSA